MPLERNIIRIGITGESGFIGRHLAGMIRITPGFRHVPFDKSFFDSPEALAEFAGECDVIVHLAAVSRSENGETLYSTNMNLVRSLADAVLRCKKVPGILFGSTVQINKELPYHASKRDGAAYLKQALEGKSWSVNMLMPNTFGPYSKPIYNSVISTFCQLAVSGKKPEQIADTVLELSYVDNLCLHILVQAKLGLQKQISRDAAIPFQYRESLPGIWRKLRRWALNPRPNPPRLTTSFDADLYRTFRSYKDAYSAFLLGRVVTIAETAQQLK